MRLILTYVFSVLISASVTAQTMGWTEISRGDFVEADSLLAAAYRRDSADIQVILGRLFLAEMYDDTRQAEYLSTRLIRITDDPMHARAFNYHVPYESPYLKEIMERPELAVSPALPFRIWYMTQHQEEYKDFAEMKKDYRNWFQSGDWYFIGPFRNVNGASHQHVLAPEQNLTELSTEPVDNGLGVDVQWFKPTYQNPGAYVDFENHLPTLKSANTAFAAKKFSLDSDQEVQLRMGRNNPVKIWVDGTLVFDDADARKIQPDDEHIGLELSKGNHLVIVKISPYSPNTRGYREFNFLGTASGLKGQDPILTLRITDERGNILPLGAWNDQGELGQVATHRVLPDLEVEGLMARIQQSEEVAPQASDLYVLTRLLIDQGRSVEAEAFIEPMAFADPDNVFLRLILTQLYAMNGKNSIAYKHLGKLDFATTPVYKVMTQRLEEADPELDRTGYETLLDQMSSIGPYNYATVEGKLKYYAAHNMKSDMDALRKELDQARPDHQFQYLFSRYDPTSRNSGRSSDEPKKGKIVKSLFQKNKRKVLAQELELYPYRMDSYTDMANYLMDKGEYAEALNMIEGGLGLMPANPEVLEMKGDVLAKMDKRDEALAAYQKAVIYTSYTGDLADKISQMSEAMTTREHFKRVEFQNILDDPAGWTYTYSREDAVILMHTTNALIDTLGLMDIRQKMMVKINNEDGVKAWKEENFSYLGNQLTIKVVKPDGTVLRPDRQGGYSVFKNLEPGDIIQAEGKSSSNLPGQDQLFGKYWTHWEFLGKDHPIHYRKFEIAVPQDEPFFYQQANIDMLPDTFHRDGYVFYRWELKDMPKLPNERAGLNYADASPQIQMANVEDWGLYAKWYQEVVYRKLDETPILRNTYNRLIEDGMTQEEKVSAIYNYITQDINYSSVYFLQSAFEPQSPDLTCATGLGDCKDVSALMVALLRMADIESYYVLVSAGSYTPMAPLPFNIFNHVIVGYVLDGEMEYIDLVTDNLPKGVLPVADAGAWGLLIKDTSHDLIRLPNSQIDEEVNTIVYNLDVKMDTAFAMQAELDATLHGLNGEYFRDYMSSPQKYYVKDLLQREMPIPAVVRKTIGEHEFEGLREIDQPLKLKVSMSAPEFSEELYGLVMFQLPLISHNEPFEELMTEDRQSILDLSRLTEVAPVEQTLTLAFPEGYQLYRLPDNVNMETRFGTYSLEFKEVPGGIQVKKSQDFTLTKVQPGDFQDFRDFYLKIVKHDRTRLVLVEEGVSLRK
ncbi:DUF3857 domain-containing protein [Pontibacter sp. G13]|uniref:transglutaminase domain-containing protein n=1 Tax=Pontibacter sp. G13 TaxID=3074898 RepID=UPI00288A43C3|nr:DUF3857 domain-containing protein [Pontibacter sp. G13]WNJ20001.1 DUF3857 domain-containing protein [Pontibacter sp. G13]